MAKIRQLGKLKIVTWFVAFVMLIASSAMLFIGCADKSQSDDDDETTPDKTDTQTFANADFEYFDDSDGEYLIATPDNWTLSSQGSSSRSKSGVVDTAADWGEKFVYARTEYEKQQDEDNEEEEPDEYYTDITEDYHVPGWDLADAARGEDDDDLTYENISADDIDKVNPKTHFAEGENKEDTHVLMLHNNRSDGYGTAARYEHSGTISLEAGSAAMLSVWVKTYGMTYNENTAVDGDRGAYIQIQSTVGGSEQDPLLVKNIDTEKLNPDGENNGWVQFTFYVQGSTYAATSFNIYLGLGRINAVSGNYYEYVQGYAFFDDIGFARMTAEEYEKAVGASDVNDSFALDASAKDGDSCTVDINSSSYRKFAITLDNITDGVHSFSLSSFDVKETVSDVKDANGDPYGLDHYLGEDANLLRDNGDAARSGIKKAADILNEANGYAPSVCSDFEKFTSLFGEDEPVYMIYSGKGAPYTASVSESGVQGADKLFTLSEGEHLMIRFMLKTSELNGGTGATVTLINYDSLSTVGALDTTTAATIDLKDDAHTDEDILDGWQLCAFYVTNDTEKDLTFSLEFSFGPTDIVDLSYSSYADGYAAFTALEYASLTDEEYELATTSSLSNTTQVSLVDSPLNTDSSVVFDEPSYPQTSTDSSPIETGFANLKNYKGVYGNSRYVGGTDLTSSVNEYKEAGLLNKKYAANYFNDMPAWLSVIVNSYTEALTADTWWKAAIGSDSTQPLLIVNSLKEAATSYGFIGGETSFVSDSYAQINLRVKMSANATAYIYLIDASEQDGAKYTDPLAYGLKISYRYDDEGNVVTVDPEDKNFNEDADTLFYLQSNGLWSTSKTHAGGAYFANLSAYDTDDDGNLVDGDGDVVYYKNGDSYFRYFDEDNDAYSVEVKDFTAAEVDKDELAAATLQMPAEKELFQIIRGSEETANEWVYLNFFIATGNISKTYRLEVWNGSRDDAAHMAAESYVIFDLVSYDTLDETSFNTLLEENLVSLGKNGKFNNGAVYSTSKAILKAYRENPDAFMAETADGTSLVYYHFSLYDNENYLPYDEDNELETRENDPYADYDPSSYSDTVAYLRFNSSLNGYTEYTTFADFGASDIAVAESTGETDKDTDETTGGTTDTNLWLLIPSIVLAAALFVTLISLLLKKVFSNIRKNKVHATAQYDARRTRYARKLKLSEQQADEETEQKDDVLPDEDEISEEEIYKVEEAENETADDEDPYADEKDDENK